MLKVIENICYGICSVGQEQQMN